MNLEGQTGLQIEISDPDPTGIVTTTIKTFDGLTVLGTITMEGLKMRTWVKALTEMVSNVYPESTPDLFKSRTEFNLVAKSGSIKFN